MAITFTKKSNSGLASLITRIYGNIDLDEKIRDIIESFLKKKLKISSLSKLKESEYFFVYKKNESSNTSISSIFIRRNSHMIFTNITKEEILNEGIHPNEIKDFLTGIGAKKFTNIKEVFVNI